jgi:hypothetical protein
LGRINEGGDGLRRFGGERLGENLRGQEEDVGFRRQRQRLQEMLGALGGKDAVEAQVGAESFFDEVGTFDADEGAVAGMGQGPAQLFQAGVLLTLYNAKRHSG